MSECLRGAQGARKVLLFPLRLLAAIFVSSLFLCALSAQGNSTGFHGKESERAAQVRALNNNVLQLHGQMQENASGAAGIRGQAASVLAQRAAALQQLIQEEAHAALTFAFSPELLADLAEKFPASSSLLESHVTLSGPVEHWIADSADMKSSHESWYINAGDGRLSLHFATPQRPDAKGNPIVTIEGVQVGSEVAVSRVVSTPVGAASGTPSKILSPIRSWPPAALAVSFAALILIVSRKLTARAAKPAMLRQFAVCALALVLLFCNPASSSAQSACSTTGPQNIAVLLVSYAGVTLPVTVTPSTMQTIFFGSTGRSLTAYWNETSYGLTTATGDIFTYNLPGLYTCGNIDQMRNDVISALSASGVSFQNYSRIVMIFPDELGCGWAGMSSVGCTSITSPTGTINASFSYLDSYYLAGTTTQAVQLVTHELGHELGLNHGRSRSFGTEALGSLGTNGATLQYGDGWTTMGFWNLGGYSAPHKTEQLGWMTGSYQTVQNGGTFTIEPYESALSGLKALKVQRGSGNDAWLWIEYRQPIGNYDPSLSPQVFSGALIHYEDSLTAPLYTDLLNFTPSDSTFNSPALAAGQTWTDPYTNLSLTVQSATSSGLTVSVNYGSTPCAVSVPKLALSPLNPSIYPGQSAGYSLTVTNNDSSACSPSTINLDSTEPAGWSTSLSTSSINLSPGQSATVTMGKGAPVGTPPGTYAVNLSASKNSVSATDTANATVMAAPAISVAISVAGTSFSRPGTVPISAVVTNGGSPAAGASVTFTVTTPTGGTFTQTATANSSGVATWSYKVNQRSAVGIYSAIAGAGVSSGSKKAASTQSAVSGSVAFTVQ